MRWVMGLAVVSATACVDGSPAPAPTHEGDAVILASGQGGPAALEVTDRGVFWTTSGDVMWLTASGDPPRTLAQDLADPRALCVTDADVFVATGGDFGDGTWRTPGGVFRVALDAGSIETVHLTDRAFGPSDIACDGAGVYWMQFWAESTGTEFVAGLMSVDAAGNRIVVVDETYPGHALALDDMFVYWQRGPDLVRTSRSDAQQAEIIAPSPAFAISLELAGGELFWINRPSNSGEPRLLRSAPDSGGSSRRVADIADQSSLPISVAADDAHVYWTEFDAGRIMRVARGGGDPEIFADGQSKPYDLALFDGAVYWTNFGSGNVVRLSR